MYDCLDGKSSIAQRKGGGKPRMPSSVSKTGLCLKCLFVTEGERFPKEGVTQ